MNHPAPPQQPQPAGNEGRRPVSTVKFVVLCILLALIVILSSATVTLYYMIEAKKEDIEKARRSGRKFYLMKKGQVVKEQLRDVLRPEDIHRNLQLYKSLAPDPTSSSMAADSNLGISFQKLMKHMLQRGRKIRYTGNWMMVMKNSNKGRKLNEYENNEVPYSGNVDYQDLILNAYSGGTKKKDNRKRGKVFDVMSWVKYHMEGAEQSYLTQIVSSIFSKAIEANPDDSLAFDKAMSKNSTAKIDSYISLREASDMGNSFAQTRMAQIYASGIVTGEDNSGKDLSLIDDLEVVSDFSEGGENLAKALTLWHFAAIGGNQEAQMALGFRSMPKFKGNYGLEPSCERALSYYEEAAHTAMDELESSSLRGKFKPARDNHRLSKIHIHGGASSTLSAENKPHESDEAIEYYRVLALNRADVHASLTLGTMYSLGVRGVSQDMALALKYFKIAADQGNAEACGQVGEMYLLGQGVEQNIFESYSYCIKGAPGGIKCVKNCDARALNCLGQLTLRGVPFRLQRDLDRALKLFRIAQERGSTDATYNLGMLEMGWMQNGDDESLDVSVDIPVSNDAVEQIAAAAAISSVESSPELQKKTKRMKQIDQAYKLFKAAGKQGHLQALHRAGMIASHGMGNIEKNCELALSHFSQIAEESPLAARRPRVAYKEYLAGNLEQALEHYLIAAETGIELAQSNAAFLLEKGVCLGMNSSDCTAASLRMWKAAASQGDAEASMKVGDFHYYGKHRKEIFDRNFIKDLLRYLKKQLIQFIRYYILGDNKREASISNKNEKLDSCSVDEGLDTCEAKPTSSAYEESLERDADYKIAAAFYKKAVDASSPQANFNLGYMHQWGIGLKQDFPLAKRHFDLAGNHVEAELPVQCALAFMNLHQWWIRVQPLSFIFNRNSDDNQIASVIIKHIFRKDSAIIVFLFSIVLVLNGYRRRRRQ